MEVGDESPCFELQLVPESLIQLISGTDPASLETEGGIYSDIPCSGLIVACLLELGGSRGFAKEGAFSASKRQVLPS